MFERFTEPARQVIVLAQDEARILMHNYIGSEHILLGLLSEEEGVPARVMTSLGVTVDRVRAQVVQIVGSGEEVTAGQIPFTPRAKKVLELALREALSLRHSYIGPEHILLGLSRENEGVAVRILLDFDADSEKVRNEVIRLVSAPDYRPPEAPARPLSARETSVLRGYGVSAARLHARSSAEREVPVHRRFDASAHRALELALADALRQDDHQLTCENLLAGLAAAEGTVAASILAEHGLDEDGLRAEIDRHEMQSRENGQ